MTTRYRSRRIAGFLCGILIATLLAWAAAILPAAPVAQAATTWHVTSTADGAATPANCPSAGCRLRDALAAAVSGDTIDFALTLPATITLNQGQLSFNTDLTVNGPTTTTLAVSANNASRVFSIGGKTSINNLTIRDGNEPADSGGAISIGSFTVLTLTNTSVISNAAQSAGGIWNNGGKLILITSTVNNNLATTAGGGIYINSSNASLILSGGMVNGNIAGTGFGGGILSGGSVTVTNSTVSLNHAGDDGGGIWSTNGTTLTISSSLILTNSGKSGAGIFSSGLATVDSSTIRANTANGNVGGGIENFGTMTLTNSTIASNVVTSTFGSGGGIYSNKTLTISNTTINNNSATNTNGNGGGIFTEGSSSHITLTNVTISGNSVPGVNGLAGGIRSGGGTTQLNNVTITKNNAGQSYGGISFAAVDFRNSIIAGNTSPSGPDCGGGGTLTSSGYNLIGNNNGCAFTAAGTDLVGTNLSPINPKLSGLGSWGGSTQTHGLLSGSPALDAIPDATNGCGTTYTTDQRGMTRPQNINCDIGAFEGFLNGIYLPLVFR